MDNTISVTYFSKAMPKTTSLLILFAFTTFQNSKKVSFIIIYTTMTSKILDW